jgi:hypothetical protein
MAEEVGFEPTKGYKPLPVFKTGAFNRSATLPNSQCLKKRVLEEARILRDFLKYSMTTTNFLSIISTTRYIPLTAIASILTLPDISSRLSKQTTEIIH